MPVKKDSTGRRFVQAEVEVPGTPDDVWQAIATGPGISSWFVPTQVDPRVGGAATSNFGPGMDSVATITTWEPPHRFAVDSHDMGPGSPTVATEWTVEARSGGTCVVRVVHSWFADTDDWDNQFEGHEHGWQAFFRILRLYLTHFRGLPSSAIQAMGMTGERKAEAWQTLVGLLGLTNVEVGQRARTSSGAPRLAGVVERIGESAYPEELLLRLEEPAPGIAHLFAMEMGGQTCLPVRIYLYCDQASTVVAHEDALWQAWIADRFPAASGASQPV